jgi:hypothetical protein
MNLQLIAYPQGTIEPLSYPTGEVILDLYKDEPIPLVLNVDDFTNVAEKASSYSKSFDIPGTKTNNLFFNHIYDITSDSNFNPHLKTKAVVKEDSIDIFSGYLQLNEIINKGEEISYEITLFSEATNLKDALSEKVFRDLDLSELTHQYDDSNIIDSWTGGLNLTNTLPADSFAGTGTTTDVLKYPLVRWNYESSYSSGSITTDIMSDFFKPFINVLYLIQNIFRDAGYSFNSTFFNTTDFNKLFVDFNNGAEDIGNINDNFQATTANGFYSYSTTSQNIDFASTLDGISITATDYYDTSTDVFTAIADGTIVFTTSFIQIATTSSASGIQTYIEWYKNGTLQSSVYLGLIYPGSSISLLSPIAYTLDNGDTFEVKLKTNSGSFTIHPSSYLQIGVFSQETNINNVLLDYKGDINQWSFFKSIINKFNLLIMVDDNNPKLLNIIPYKDWVDAGNLIDWTHKIDDTEIKYNPIDGLANKLIFKNIEDSDDWITDNHNNDAELKYAYNRDNNIEIFDTDIDTIEVEEIANTYTKYQLGGELFAPQIVDNTGATNFQNVLRLLYDNGVKTMSSHSYDIINTVTPWTATSDYLLFSPLSEYPTTSTTKSYDFGVVNYSGSIVLNSLYNVYWDKYIDELYHKDTRIVELKVYLTSKDLSDFNFNDIILVKNKKFRVKKIEYKSGAMSKVELITIKDL